MHSNTYSPQKRPTNGKKWQKMSENCKIPEITKYGEKVTKIDKNVKQCKKMPKRAKNEPKTAKFKKRKNHRFSGSKLAKKIDTVG